MIALALGALVLAFVVVALVRGAGNAQAVESRYGSTMGTSVNGTGAFAALLRNQGHTVPHGLATYRGAGRLGRRDRSFRLTRRDRRIGRKLNGMMTGSRAGRNQDLVYVVRDYDARERILEPGDRSTRLPSRRGASQAGRTNRDGARDWVSRLPGKEAKPADAESWFAVDRASDPPRTCKSLGGPWAEEIDAPGAALTVHESLKAGENEVLLTGDGEALVLEWEVGQDSWVLAIANGSFLLNLPLVIPARRPLAERVVEWIGEEPRRIAFVEGPLSLGDSEVPPTLIELITRINSFRWVALHLGVFGVLACLARAPRLGRPSPEPSSDADRPAAHAEAVGALLERSRANATARELLKTYRHWRFPPRRPLESLPTEDSRTSKHASESGSS